MIVFLTYSPSKNHPVPISVPLVYPQISIEVPRIHAASVVGPELTTGQIFRHGKNDIGAGKNLIELIEMIEVLSIASIDL